MPRGGLTDKRYLKKLMQITHEDSLCAKKLSTQAGGA